MQNLFPGVKISSESSFKRSVLSVLNLHAQLLLK